MIRYSEEEIRNWEREGGAFLIREGIVDTDDIEEVREFKRKIEEEEQEDVRKSNNFSIIKLNERSDTMREYLNDSGFDEVEELEDLVEKFEEEDLDDDILKQIKVMPEKLKNVLKECYKTLNEFKSELKEIPELLSAVQVLGRLAAGKPGKYPTPSGEEPGEYPYPSKKVKKAMDWSQVQDMLFGGHIPADEEIEKSSKENPFPSITRAIKIKKEAMDELEDEMEESSFNPYDRMV